MNTGFGGRAPPGTLLFMPISDDGAPESITPDRVNALVGSSEVPLAAVDLPSGRLLAVNPGLAGPLGSTVGALTGSSSLDWLPPDDRQAARLGFQALADGELTGYQAIRRFTNLLDPDQVFSVWVSARPSTVREHLSSIYAKLGVHSQVDLIRRVRRGEQRPAADR